MFTILTQPPSITTPSLEASDHINNSLLTLAAQMKSINQIPEPVSPKISHMWNHLQYLRLLPYNNILLHHIQGCLLPLLRMYSVRGCPMMEYSSPPHQTNFNILLQYQISTNIANNPKLHVSTIRYHTDTPFVLPPNTQVQVFGIDYHNNYLYKTSSPLMQTTSTVLMGERTQLIVYWKAKQRMFRQPV